MAGPTVAQKNNYLNRNIVLIYRTDPNTGEKLVDEEGDPLIDFEKTKFYSADGSDDTVYIRNIENGNSIFKEMANEPVTKNLREYLSQKGLPKEQIYNEVNDPAQVLAVLKNKDRKFPTKMLTYYNKFLEEQNLKATPQQPEAPPQQESEVPPKTKTKTKTKKKTKKGQLIPIRAEEPLKEPEGPPQEPEKPPEVKQAETEKQQQQNRINSYVDKYINLENQSVGSLQSSISTDISDESTIFSTENNIAYDYLTKMKQRLIGYDPYDMIKLIKPSTYGNNDDYTLDLNFPNKPTKTEEEEEFEKEYPVLQFNEERIAEQKLNAQTPGQKDLQTKSEAEALIGEAEARVAQAIIEDDEDLTDDIDLAFQQLKHSGLVYTDEEIIKFKDYLKDKDKKTIGDFMLQIKTTPSVIDFSRYISQTVTQQPAQTIEQEPAEQPQTVGDTSVGTTTVNPFPIPEEYLTETTTEEPKKDIIATGNSSITLPYRKRYHPKQLTNYFGDSSNPRWDRQLEQNIRKADYTEDERIEIMDDIIANYGKKIFVRKRLSTTVDETIELQELMFKYKNISNVNSDMAQVKLSDLNKIRTAADKLAIDSAGAQGGTPATQDATTMQESQPQQLANDPISISQTEEETKFIYNYDKWMANEGLDIGKIYIRPNRDPDIYTKRSADPHTLSRLF